MTSDRYTRGWEKLKEIDGEAGERVIEALKDIAPDPDGRVRGVPGGAQRRLCSQKGVCGEKRGGHHILKRSFSAIMLLSDFSACLLMVRKCFFVALLAFFKSLLSSALSKSL